MSLATNLNKYLNDHFGLAADMCFTLCSSFPRYNILCQEEINIVNTNHLLDKLSGLRYEVFTAVKSQVKVFWVVASCSLAVGYRRFGGPRCLHLQGDGSSNVLK